MFMVETSTPKTLGLVVWRLNIRRAKPLSREPAAAG